MEGKAKVMGHSIHPILIVFPLGLLASAVIFDSIRLMGGPAAFTVVVYWLIAGGLFGGVLASVFGFIDWFAIPQGTRAKRFGIYHAVSNGFVMVLYAASLYFRHNDPGQPEIIATVFSTVGAGFALIAGWLGGELVERLGVGVHDNAGLNAPSSLVVSENFRSHHKIGRRTPAT